MNILKFNDVYMAHTAAIVGKKEGEGPLGGEFDAIEEDIYFGCKTFEQAESELGRLTLNLLLGKAGRKPEEIELLLGGDLMNQCAATTFAVYQSDIPFLGLFGACSTMIEGILTGAAFISGGFVSNAAAMASSHFCTAERQFRFPLEYGSQRTPTAQNTVTGCGACLLQRQEAKIKVEEAVIGKIVDNGSTDANNMGAAMATAAVDTLLRYFNESKRKPDSFDLIVTGDLGVEGNAISNELLRFQGYRMGENFTDTGLMIYDIEKQDVHAGGSGCGCIASVFCGHLFKRMMSGELKDVLLVGTGALLNKGTVMQKQTIPSIAHLVRITAS